MTGKTSQDFDYVVFRVYLCLVTALASCQTIDNKLKVYYEYQKVQEYWASCEIGLGTYWD